MTGSNECFTEDTEITAIKRVEKMIHDSSNSLYYHILYTVLVIESFEREWQRYKESLRKLC